jgi:dihydroxy-acid dehydratase
VQTGDEVSLDVERRRLDLHIPDDEQERRRRLFQPPVAPFSRGYGKMYVEHVTQADEGCDFDFLSAAR